MELAEGFIAGVMATLTVLCAVQYRRGKDPALLWASLITAALVPTSLLSSHYRFVTAPVTWAAFVAAGFLAWRVRKRHT